MPHACNVAQRGDQRLRLGVRLHAQLFGKGKSAALEGTVRLSLATRRGEDTHEIRYTSSSVGSAAMSASSGAIAAVGCPTDTSSLRQGQGRAPSLLSQVFAPRDQPVGVGLVSKRITGIERQRLPQQWATLRGWERLRARQQRLKGVNIDPWGRFGPQGHHLAP